MPDLRPSPGALLRLIARPRILINGGMWLLFLSHFSRDPNALGLLPGFPLPESARIWLVNFVFASVAGSLTIDGVLSDLRASNLAPMLPGLERGLRRGLALLAGALGVGAGLAALALGQGIAEALALAAFSACLLVVSTYAPIWTDGIQSMTLWALFAPVLMFLPILTIFLAPAFPARVGMAQPLATVGVGLLLMVVLLRFFPLLEPRWKETPDGPDEDERTDQLSGEAPRHFAWAAAPVRTGLRFWWLELSGRQLASGRRMLVLYPLLGFGLALVSMVGGHWLALVFMLVGARIPPVSAPLGGLHIPVSRMDRARIAWTADLLQTAALLAGAAGFLLLAPLVSPDRFMAVPGPQPGLVLAAVAASLSMNGALNAALGVGSTSPRLGRHLFSMLLLIALALALVYVVELSPPVAAWPLLLAAGITGPAAAYLLFLRHLARCPLGPHVRD